MKANTKVNIHIVERTAERASAPKVSGSNFLSMRKTMANPAPSDNFASGEISSAISKACFGISASGAADMTASIALGRNTIVTQAKSHDVQKHFHDDGLVN